MTDVYPPSSREDAILEVPVPFRRAGTWHGEIRARLVDDDGEWFFELRFNTGIAENRVGTFPAAWVRRPELTDMDGIVPPDTLAMMREARVRRIDASERVRLRLAASVIEAASGDRARRPSNVMPGVTSLHVVRLTVRFGPPLPVALLEH